MNIIDKNSLLNAAQKKLLQDCAQISFNLGKFSSIDDILTKLKVDVYIEPGIVTRSIPSELYQALEYWKMKKDDDEAQEMVKLIYKEIDFWRQMPLRGLYDPIANAIKLYPEEMHQEYGDKRMKELLVSTLVHEAMHAYFNRPRHKSFPYVIFVEEPLAEFGMLLYLYGTGSKYYNWALKDVSSKRTCYKYGANLMKQCLAEGANSPTRKYLEAYKVKLNVYDIPDYPQPRLRGKNVLPNSSPVYVNGHPITPKWKNVFSNLPRYFYDSANKILGLDGDWSGERWKTKICDDVRVYSNVDNNISISSNFNKPINTIYLGDNFYPCSSIGYNLLSHYDVQVSPKNKLLESKIINYFTTPISIPVFKKDKKPALDSCGKGYYKICRNGKWGVIDDQLNLIIDIKYDFVWGIDNNDLFMVRIDINSNHYYGLVNKQGVEQVKPIYDHITDNSDGTYTVKKDGVEFKIDQNGNKVP